MHSFIFRCAPPQVVAFAESVEQVSGVTKLCNEHRVPLIPFGSGTGLEGGINAIKVRFIPSDSHTLYRLTGMIMLEMLLFIVFLIINSSITDNQYNTTLNKI